MPAPTITALPVAPQRADEPATFVTKADDFVAALDPLVTEINAFGTYLNGLGIGVLSWKAPVRVATAVAGTLATSFENGDTVDGVVLATGDRILLKNQSAGTENGIYIVAASGAPTRADDADDGAELVNAAVIVSEGTANADTLWICTTNATITIGATAIAFAQLGTGGYAPGGTDVAIADGGTGASNAADARANLGLARVLSCSITGTALTSNEVLAAITPPIGETWTFAANFANASGKKLTGGTNPAASYAIDVSKNGSTVGTITISTAGVVSFATAGGAAFSLIGGTDELRFIGPATVDTAVGYALTIPLTY